MALRQVGGVPVYSIDVEVPKPTDSRGRGYGLLVSDLRWKLWEEVKDAQIQQMRVAGAADAAIADALAQQAKDISRTIREAEMAKAKVKTGESSKSQAIKDAVNLYKISGTEVKQEDIVNMFGRKTGEIKETKIARSPGYQARKTLAESETNKETETPATETGAELQYDPATLDNYIKELEAKQANIADQLSKIGQGGTGPDLLSRTRVAYQSQIGEGGFGISKRPTRQIARFDEGAAMQALQPMADLKNRITELEAMFGEDAKAIPEYSRLTNQFEASMNALQSEARPVTSREFLRKPEVPLPPVSTEPKYQFGNFIPTEMTNKQDYIQRLTDKAALRSEVAPNISAEEELIQLAAEDAARKAAPRGVISPSADAMRRAIEMEALGIPAVAPTAQAIAEQAPFKATYPVETAGGLQTEMSGLGRPGGTLDTIRYLRQKNAEERAAKAATPTPATPTPATPSASVEMLDEMGNPIVPANPFDVMKEDLMLRKQNIESMKKLQAEQPQASVTPASRQSLYAMRVVKGGLEMAAKPKQLARLAKTELPTREREKAAPEYIIVVDKLYNVNKGKPNAFKNTYDEVARTYKDDPAVREQAQKYLVAKDTLEGQVTNPTA